MKFKIQMNKLITLLNTCIKNYKIKILNTNTPTLGKVALILVPLVQLLIASTIGFTMYLLMSIDTTKYNVEINALDLIFKHNLINVAVCYGAIGFSMQLLMLWIKQNTEILKKWIRYTAIVINLVLSGTSIFILPQVITILNQEELPVDGIRLNRWTFLRRLWSADEKIKHCDSIFQQNHFIPTPDEKKEFMVLVNQSPEHRIEDLISKVKPFIETCLQTRKEIKANIRPLTWTEWLAPYFTSEYYYAGQITVGITTAVVSYGLWWWFFGGGGGDTPSPKGSETPSILLHTTQPNSSANNLFDRVVRQVKETPTYEEYFSKNHPFKKTPTSAPANKPNLEQNTNIADDFLTVSSMDNGDSDNLEALSTAIENEKMFNFIKVYARQMVDYALNAASNFKKRAEMNNAPVTTKLLKEDLKKSEEIEALADKVLKIYFNEKANSGEKIILLFDFMTAEIQPAVNAIENLYK